MPDYELNPPRTYREVIADLSATLNVLADELREMGHARAAEHVGEAEDCLLAAARILPLNAEVKPKRDGGQ